ncbi:hypothetical protein SprV_0100082500 [Sparganum proliferum]
MRSPVPPVKTPITTGPVLQVAEAGLPQIDFLDAGMNGSKKALKSAMTSKGEEFASWKTSTLEVQNFIMQRTEPFFALLVNLFGFYRKCLDVEGHVDLKKMIRCQACPSLEPFLDRLFQSQMVHCFFEDRLREQRLDPFETRCRSLTDSCLARCPPDAINFGDAIWITCKRNATSGGLRRYNRMRQKFSRHIFKNSSKSKGRHDRDSGLITFGGARGDDASFMGRSISFTTGQLDESNSAAGNIRQNSLIPPLPRPKSTFSLALEQPESSSTSSATTTSRNGVGVTAPAGSSSSSRRNNNPSSLFPTPQSRTLPSGPRPPIPPRPLRPSRPPRATEMATVSSPNRKILTSANSVDATMSASTMGLQRTNFTGASPANTLLSEIQKKLDSMESSGSFRKSVSASNLIVNTTSSSEYSVFQDVLNSEQLTERTDAIPPS